MVLFEVSPDFGFVIFSVIASVFVLFWLGWNVGHIARPLYGVKYPKMYADDDTSNGHMFNCYQRAHQNTLEGYPIFLVLLLLGGLYLPRLSAAAGLLWSVGRVMYAKGYYTGDPSKRVWGIIHLVGLLILMVNTCLFACKILGWFTL